MTNVKHFLHIGLPKTGTTTLQQKVFPEVFSEGFYAGRYADDKLSSKILSVIQEVSIGYGVNSEAKVRYKEALQEIPAQKKFLLLSDEMLTVNSEGVTWDEKINNVLKFLSGYEVSVIITIRDPIAALYSFYIETYNVREKGVGFSEYMLLSQAKIYSVMPVVEVVEKYTSKIILGKFEDIFVNGLCLPFLRRISNELNLTVINRLPVTNIKQSNADGYYTSRPTIRSIMSRCFVLKNLTKFIMPRSTYKLVLSYSDFFSVGKSKHIPYPTDSEIIEFYKQNNIELEMLKNKYGVDFNSGT
jgi:hypothetical protein